MLNIRPGGICMPTYGGINGFFPIIKCVQLEREREKKMIKAYKVVWSSSCHMQCAAMEITAMPSALLRGQCCGTVCSIAYCLSPALQCWSNVTWLTFCQRTVDHYRWYMYNVSCSHNVNLPQKCSMSCRGLQCPWLCNSATHFRFKINQSWS